MTKRPTGCLGAMKNFAKYCYLVRRYLENVKLLHIVLLRVIIHYVVRSRRGLLTHLGDRPRWEPIPQETYVSNMNTSVDHPTGSNFGRRLGAAFSNKFVSQRCSHLVANGAGQSPKKHTCLNLAKQLATASLAR